MEVVVNMGLDWWLSIGLNQELGEQIPIIGVGGIDSYVAAKEKLLAGAKLVQVYSGFIYQGPRLVADIVKNI